MIKLLFSYIKYMILGSMLVLILYPIPAPAYTHILTMGIKDELSSSYLTNDQNVEPHYKQIESKFLILKLHEAKEDVPHSIWQSWMPIHRPTTQIYYP